MVYTYAKYFSVTHPILNGTEKQTYFYRRNLQGDVTHIFDEAGVLKAKYAYDAWGNCKTIYSQDGIATLNPIRYRGYYFDNETGLYFLQTRYYDPQVGRFISPDSIEYLDPGSINGLNLYAYCGNDPVNRVDPKGNAWYEFWKWDWAKIGMITLSLQEIVGGIVITALTGGLAAYFGMGMIGMGLSSLIGGITNELVGGSFLAGWVGGQVGGLITNVPGFGGFLGAFVNSALTDLIDKGWSNIEWGKAGISGVVGGVFDLLPQSIGLENIVASVGTRLIFSYRGALTGIISSIFNTIFGKKNSKENLLYGKKVM